jgi:hypothetical protein
METHSARFYVSDLKRLLLWSKKTNIVPGIWLRNALHELIAMLDREGQISLPFVVVPRNKAEQAGLVPPQEEETQK